MQSYGWTAEQALELCEPDQSSTALDDAQSDALLLEARGGSSSEGSLPRPLESHADDTAEPVAEGQHLEGQPEDHARDNGHPQTDLQKATAAAAELARAAGAVWPPLLEPDAPGTGGGGLRPAEGGAGAWRVTEIRSGVRALPPRTASGSVPMIGRLSPPRKGTIVSQEAAVAMAEGGGKNEEATRNWWVLVGLGARGLVYHAWLGQQMAKAMLANDEREIRCQELLDWNQQQRQ